MARQRLLARRPHQTQSRHEIEARQGQIVGHAQRQHQPFSSALRGNVADATRDRGVRVSARPGLVVEQDSTGGWSLQTGQRAQHRLAAGAQHTAQSDDLAGADIERHIVEHTGQAQPSDAQDAPLGGAALQTLAVVLECSSRPTISRCSAVACVAAVSSSPPSLPSRST